MEDELQTEKKEITEKEEIKKKKKLTLKQRRWLALYLKTGNASAAAMEVYDTTDEHVAESIGSENLRKLELPINKLMDEMGLSNEYLLIVLQENLRATKLYGKNGIIHGDYASRNKALEIAGKMKGILTERIDLSGNLISSVKVEIVEKNETT
jgi:hypothetical protein